MENSASPQRSVEELLQYIDTRYANMLARPRMFAQDVVMLEDNFMQFEEIREFVRPRPRKTVHHCPPNSMYYKFCSKYRDIGSSRYSFRLEEPDSEYYEPDPDRRWQRMCDFFRQYLAETRSELDVSSPEVLDREFPHPVT